MYSRGDHCLTDRVGGVPSRNVPGSLPSRSLSMHSGFWCFALTCVMAVMSAPAAAQDESRAFAGALFGVSALSADAQAVTTGADAAVSLYDPKNGSALNVFAGIHVAQYFSAPGQLDVEPERPHAGFLVRHRLEPAVFMSRRRDSSQHALVFDGLIYFRRQDSSIRPYLGTGLSVVRFSSEKGDSRAQGLSPPAGEISIDACRPPFACRDRLQVVASCRLPVQLQRNDQRQPD